jgi:hypothetical protein
MACSPSQRKFSKLNQRASRGMVSVVLNPLRFRGRNQRDGGLGGEQEERKCLLQVQADGSIVVVEVADGDVLADVQVEITTTGGQYESAGNGGAQMI